MCRWKVSETRRGQALSFKGTHARAQVSQHAALQGCQVVSGGQQEPPGHEAVPTAPWLALCHVLVLPCPQCPS